METPASINLLAIIILEKEQFGELTRKLVANHFYFTEMDSSGAFLQRATSTLLVGINASRYDELVNLVQKCCKRRRIYIPANMEPTLLQSNPLMVEAEVGGASIFAIEIERFEKF
jgi:uncharacterized protein YaaQ